MESRFVQGNTRVTEMPNLSLPFVDGKSLTAVLEFEVLPECANLKTTRFDLVRFTGLWHPIMHLLNDKGDFILRLCDGCDNRTRSRRASTPRSYLAAKPQGYKSSINLSGLRFSSYNNLVASGEPPKERYLKVGENPMYLHSNDGFVFIFSEDMRHLTVLVFKGQRYYIDTIRDDVARGCYDAALEEKRLNAAPYIPENAKKAAMQRITNQKPQA